MAVAATAVTETGLTLGDAVLVGISDVELVKMLWEEMTDLEEARVDTHGLRDLLREALERFAPQASYTATMRMWEDCLTPEQAKREMDATRPDLVRRQDARLQAQSAI